MLAKIYPSRVVFKETELVSFRSSIPRPIKPKRLSPLTRPDSPRRAKSRVRDLIEVNFFPGDWFITLTYKENMVNRNKAIKDFKIYRNKLLPKLADKRYLAVIEEQKRGALHFHLLLKKSNSVDNFEKWPHGFVFKKQLYGQKYSSYLSKYIEKSPIRLSGDRHYLRSTCLQTPIEMVEEVAEELYAYITAIKNVTLNIFQCMTNFVGCVTFITATFKEDFFFGGLFAKDIANLRVAPLRGLTFNI